MSERERHTWRARSGVTVTSCVPRDEENALLALVHAWTCAVRKYALGRPY